MEAGRGLPRGQPAGRSGEPAAERCRARAEVANVHLDVNRDDRLNGLPPGSPEYQQVYSELEAEAAALVAPGLRRQVIATINRYSDPSMIAAPRRPSRMEW
ncbi:MAG: hypothetical protein R3E12_14450 [Candidatus Eisenbacteria bacterium]